MRVTVTLGEGRCSSHTRDRHDSNKCQDPSLHNIAPSMFRRPASQSLSGSKGQNASRVPRRARRADEARKLVEFHISSVRHGHFPGNHLDGAVSRFRYGAISRVNVVLNALCPSALSPCGADVERVEVVATGCQPYALPRHSEQIGIRNSSNDLVARGC